MRLFIKKHKIFLIFIAIFSLTLSFAIYTNHAWEDWYITYRCSKNLSLGNGLVYQIGQRVHAFTSPIGTLIPAILNIITLNISDELVLWLFRIIGCFLLGFSAILLFKIAKKFSFCLFATIFLISMFGTNIKIIDFSINGMETAFMIFFLTCVIYFMTAAPPSHLSLKLGLAWAGLMWTRPDSFIYIGSISIGYLLFNPCLTKGYSRKELIKIYLKSAIVLIALYCPWILWAWYYYGNPIPNTVTAKGVNIFFYLKETPVEYFSCHANMYKIILRLRTYYYNFMPAYFEMGGWNKLEHLYSLPLSLISSFYWVFPFANPGARAISFALILIHIHFSYIVNWIAPWYMPPLTLLSIFVLSHIFHQAITFKPFLSPKTHMLIKLLKPPRMIINLFATLIFTVSLSLTLNSAYQLHIQQKIIENGNRKNIGLWLKENAATNKDTVFLEPLGYIGFFSQLKMYDSVGLCSAEVVRARKKLKNNATFANLILDLQPDWLVLRPNEINDIQNEKPALLTKLYQTTKFFDVSEKIREYHFIHGKNYLLCDQTFTIFKKRRQEGLRLKL